MSRSFGDIVATQAGVIHKPEIKHFTVNDTDRALVLASDGVWEFLTNKAITRILIDCIKAKNPKKGCEKIMAESLKHWKSKDSTIDDITVIVVLLPKPKITSTKSI